VKQKERPLYLASKPDDASAVEQNEKQIRKLREQADKARQSGNTRRALELYHDLCKAEPTEPRWPQQCGELHRKLGQLEESLEHFVAAAQIYKEQGFDVKAVAMCKVVLGLDPLNTLGLNLLEEITSTPKQGLGGASPQSLSRLQAAPPPQVGSSPPTGPSTPSEPRPSGRQTCQPAGQRAVEAALASPGVDLDLLEDDPFSPTGTTAQSESLGGRGPASSPGMATVATPHQVKPPASLAPRRATKETSPKELQALNLSELEELLQPSSQGAGSPRTGGAVYGGDLPGLDAVPARVSPVKASAPSPRATLDLDIEIEGFDSVLGPAQVAKGAAPTPTQAATQAPALSRPPRSMARETLTLSEDELEILEQGPMSLEDEALVALDAPLQTPAAQATPSRPLTAQTDAGQVPKAHSPQALSISETELEILDDSDLAFMEALEKSTTGEQKQAKKRPTLTPNAPLESLELKDVMPRMERLPSQPDMEELYEIELGEIEPETPTSRPVETSDYQRRLTPAKPPPDMTPPGLFRALGIDATKSLVTRMSFVEKKPGEVVIKQGDVGGSLYVIVRGEVRIVKELGEKRVEISRLGEGEFFGEMALVTDTPRVATVEAVTELDLLEVSRETLRLLIQDFPQVVPNLIKFLKDRLLEVFVKTSDLLRPVPEKYRWQLARKFKLYEIPENKVILREGKPSGGMFIFLAGQASVTRQRRGKTLRLADLGPGALIGEISLLTGGAAVATVTASTKCWLLAVSQKQFEVLCQSFPQMRSFVEEVAEQRRKENAQLLSGDISFVSQELRLV
jgi:CRP-like cAMP-binding protein